MYRLVFLFFLIFNLLSCGGSKKITQPVQFSPRYIELFHESVRYKQKMQFENAVKGFETCVAINSKDDASYYALSEIYLATKQVNKSLEALQKAHDIDPENQWYLEELTYQYHELGKFKEASQGYTKLLQKNPTNANWILNLSECQLKNGNLKEAISSLDRLEKVLGMNAQIAIEKYQVFRYMKEDQKAENTLLAALELFPSDADLLANLVDYYFEKKQDEKAIQLLKRLSKSDRKNGVVHMTLAQYYLQKNDLPSVYAELKLGFDCLDVAVDTKTRFISYFIDSQAKLNSNVIELAVKLVDNYPDDARVHALLGDALLKNGKEEEALKAYQESLKYDISKYSLWEQVLLMEYEFRQFERLYTDGKKCIEYYPSYSKNYLLTGISANQTKRYKEAIEILELGKEYVLADAPIKAEFFAQMGYAYFKLKYFDKAQKSFDDAIEIDPTNQVNLNNYAYYLANEKLDLAKAEKMIKEVLLLRPNDAHYLDTYAWILFQKGEYTAALVEIKKAIQEKTNDPSMIDHYGDILYKLGNTSEAITHWKTALELGGKNVSLPIKIETKKYHEPSY